MPLSPNQAWDAVAYSAAKKVFYSLCCVRTPTKLAAKVPLLDEYDTYGLYAVWVCSSDDPLRFKFRLPTKPPRVTFRNRKNEQVRCDTSHIDTGATQWWTATQINYNQVLSERGLIHPICLTGTNCQFCRSASRLQISYLLSAISPRKYQIPSELWSQTRLRDLSTAIGDGAETQSCWQPPELAWMIQATCLTVNHSLLTTNTPHSSPTNQNYKVWRRLIQPCWLRSKTSRVLCESMVWLNLKFKHAEQTWNCVSSV